MIYSYWFQNVNMLKNAMIGWRALSRDVSAIDFIRLCVCGGGGGGGGSVHQ